jgi:hypothetical protein
MMVLLLGSFPGGVPAMVDLLGSSTWIFGHYDNYTSPPWMVAKVCPEKGSIQDLRLHPPHLMALYVPMDFVAE